MSTLLHIDSSPLYGRSVSRELTAAFVTQWKASHPDGRVVDRDLNATAMPPITAEWVGAAYTPEECAPLPEWVGAAYTPEEARTPEQNELLALSDTLLAELEQADEYVFGVPMRMEGSLIATSTQQQCRRSPRNGSGPRTLRKRRALPSRMNCSRFRIPC